MIYQQIIALLVVSDVTLLMEKRGI